MNIYRFSIPIQVRIGDINYGNHVGYHCFFLYFQDARISYLGQFGYSESNIEGYAMIVAEASCKYKHEVFHGDALEVKCRTSHIRNKSFRINYEIEKDGIPCAEGQTINMCLDRNSKKVVKLPSSFVKTVLEYEGPSCRSR